MHTVNIPSGCPSLLGDAVAVLPDALTFALGAIASEQRAAQRAKHWTQAPQDLSAMQRQRQLLQCV